MLQPVREAVSDDRDAVSLLEEVLHGYGRVLPLHAVPMTAFSFLCGVGVLTAGEQNEQERDRKGQ
ncbi:MAG: hypothetical protein P1V35_02155 [Planctomycetota bacterium]|nr:hypothetical protein [Planctomycetota bacterium]